MTTTFKDERGIEIEFLKSLENGDVTLDKTFVDQDESEKYWKVILSVSNIEYFRFQDSGFLKDCEENIPKLIENNPKLSYITLEFFGEVLNFNSKLLKQSLKKHTVLKCLSLIQFRDKEIKNDLRILFEAFEKSFISELRLDSIEINNTIFKSISKMNNLESMTFNECIFNESIYHSKIFLKEVEFTFNEVVTSSKNEIPYNIIEKMENLTSLYFFGKKISLDCLKLANALKGSKLKMLFLIKIDHLKNPDYFKDIIVKNLECLEICRIDSDIPYFSILKDNTNLKELKFSKVRNFKDLDIFLLNNQVIQALNIGDIHNSMRILSKGLSNNFSLESLSLQNLPKDDIQYLKEGLMSQVSLTSLNLYSCNIHDDCSFFSDYLSSNRVLKSLLLKASFIGDQGVKYICDGLKETKILQSLDLGENLIQEKGCRDLGNLLKFNKSIQRLYLRNNPVGNNGINYISDGLMYNTSLTDLDCISISIDMEKVEDFLSNLFYNLTLIECQIGLKNQRRKHLIIRNRGFISTLKLPQYFHDIKFQHEN